MVTISRGLSAAQIAARQGVFFPIVLVDIDWPSGRVRAHSGVGDIEWDGKTWRGVGRFGGIELPEDAFGMAASPATIRLYGDPAVLLAEIDQPVRGRSARIWNATTTTPGGSVLACEPDEYFSGYCDAVAMPVEKSADRGQVIIAHMLTVTLGVGPGQRSAVNLFHSHEDQASRYPSDTAGRLTIRARDNLATMTWPED